MTLILRFSLIYRVPGNCENISIQIYENVLQKLSSFRCDIMVGTDQNFNYLNLKHDGTVPTVSTNQRLPFPSIISHNVSYMREQMFIHRHKH